MVTFKRAFSMMTSLILCGAGALSLLLTPLLFVRPVSAQSSDDVMVTRNIAYAQETEAHTRRVLDVYVPSDASPTQPAPVLMFVSGGGWTQGSKAWVANVGMALAQRGIMVVIPDHRLAPDVTYAGQVTDLALAFGWIQNNIAAYGGDPQRLFIGGHSAGAHLSSLLALDAQFLATIEQTPDAISGVIPVSGLMVIREERPPSVFGDDSTAYSPISHVRPGLPPFLLMYAEDDLNGLRAANIEMAQALEAVNVPVTLNRIGERNHFDIMHRVGTPADPTTRLIIDWITSQAPTPSPDMPEATPEID